MPGAPSARTPAPGTASIPRSPRHKHDDTDEFFLVLDGQLLIDLEQRDTITLDAHQGFTVPKGVVHRTRAPRRTSILMIEAAGVVPTGD